MKKTAAKMSKKSVVGTGNKNNPNTPPKGAIPAAKMGGAGYGKMKMGGSKKK